MSRLRSILFHALSALSLLLCIGAVNLWLRSYEMPECLSWWGGNRSLQLYSDSGHLALVFDFLPPPPPDAPPRKTYWRQDRDYTQSHYNFWIKSQSLGFGIGHLKRLYGGWPSYEVYLLMMPAWFISTLLLIFPLKSAKRVWMATVGRVKKGHCSNCGYDLRATPDRCPECGTIPTSNGDRI